MISPGRDHPSVSSPAASTRDVTVHPSSHPTDGPAHVLCTWLRASTVLDQTAVQQRVMEIDRGVTTAGFRRQKHNSKCQRSRGVGWSRTTRKGSELVVLCALLSRSPFFPALLCAGRLVPTLPGSSSSAPGWLQPVGELAGDWRAGEAGGWPVALMEAAFLQGHRSCPRPLSPGYSSPWLPETLLPPLSFRQARDEDSPLLRGQGCFCVPVGPPHWPAPLRTSLDSSVTCWVGRLVPPGSYLGRVGQHTAGGRQVGASGAADSRRWNSMVSLSLPALTLVSAVGNQLLQEAENMGILSP